MNVMSNLRSLGTIGLGTQMPQFIVGLCGCFYYYFHLKFWEVFEDELNNTHTHTYIRTHMHIYIHTYIHNSAKRAELTL